MKILKVILVLGMLWNGNIQNVTKVETETSIIEMGSNLINGINNNLNSFKTWFGNLLK